MINTLIAILVHHKLMTQEEGQELASKIGLATLPSDYKSAVTQIEKFYKEISS